MSIFKILFYLTPPFVGVLLMVGGVKYVAPLASPKLKHKTMKNQPDFLKINNGIWGAINFNNMIPVVDCLIKKVDINMQDEKYRELLSNQLSWCNANKDKIIKTASILHNKISKNTAHKSLKERCCDFKLPKQRLDKYISENINASVN